MVSRSINPKIVETPALRIFEPTTFGSFTATVGSNGQVVLNVWLVMSLYRSATLFGSSAEVARAEICLNRAGSLIREKLFTFQDVPSRLPPRICGTTDPRAGQSQHQPNQPMSGGASLRITLE